MDKDLIQRTFSRKLRIEMENREVSQRELANIMGVSESTISRYLSGERMPTIYQLIEIAESLWCTPNDLLK